METLATAPTPIDPSVNVWIESASKGLRRLIRSVNDLDEARRAAALALTGDRLPYYSLAGALPAERHRLRIQHRSYDLMSAARGLGRTDLVDFLIEDELVK